MTGYRVIVQKSTVPVGTARRIEEDHQRRISPSRRRSTLSVNPEFLREGSAVEDFMRPDRVVVGADSERAMEVMREHLRPALS